MCGVTIQGLEENRAGARILLENDSAIEAGLIVIGIGAIPNIELARDAGLAIDNGIAVDAYLRTSAADIFAAGDCCSFPCRIMAIAVFGWKPGAMLRIRASLPPPIFLGPRRR